MGGSVPWWLHQGFAEPVHGASQTRRVHRVVSRLFQQQFEENTGGYWRGLERDASKITRYRPVFAALRRRVGAHGGNPDLRPDSRDGVRDADGDAWDVGIRSARDPAEAHGAGPHHAYEMGPWLMPVAHQQLGDRSEKLLVVVDDEDRVPWATHRTCEERTTPGWSKGLAWEALGVSPDRAKD